MVVDRVGRIVTHDVGILDSLQDIIVVVVVGTDALKRRAVGIVAMMLQCVEQIDAEFMIISLKFFIAGKGVIMFLATHSINHVNAFTLLDWSCHIGLKGDVRRCPLIMLLYSWENIIAQHACIHFGQQTTVDEFGIAQVFLHDTVTFMKR